MGAVIFFKEAIRLGMFKYKMDDFDAC